MLHYLTLSPSSQYVNTARRTLLHPPSYQITFPSLLKRYSALSIISFLTDLLTKLISPKALLASKETNGPPACPLKRVRLGQTAQRIGKKTAIIYIGIGLTVCNIDIVPWQGSATFVPSSMPSVLQRLLYPKNPNLYERC